MLSPREVLYHIDTPSAQIQTMQQVTKEEMLAAGAVK